MDEIHKEYEKEKSMAEKIIKDLQIEKETLMDKFEGQERLLDLLYDDIERKNKEIHDLKKKVVINDTNDEKVKEMANFERKKETV
jgi:hypothetical protein